MQSNDNPGAERDRIITEHVFVPAFVKRAAERGRTLEGAALDLALQIAGDLSSAHSVGQEAALKKAASDLRKGLGIEEAEATQAKLAAEREADRRAAADPRLGQALLSAALEARGIPAGQDQGSKPAA